MDDETPFRLAALADQLSGMIELAAGHREKCKAAGFSDDSAESMGVALHNAIVTNIVGGKSNR